VVLLDEPMTGLDPIARHELSQQIVALARGGVGVLVSSHVLHELEAIVDRVALIHQGRLMAEGKVRELRGQLRGQPHRLRLVSDRPRELAAALVALRQVIGLQIQGDAVEVALSGEPGFYAALTGIAAAADFVQEARPLDDSLASVFGYLVG
jgi:ABC-type multidrug transport system ATPase subunit